MWAKEVTLFRGLWMQINRMEAEFSEYLIFISLQGALFRVRREINLELGTSVNKPSVE